MKVSVVIPMHNSEKTIVECIDSVLAQTFKSFEIICVDDGSSDATLEFVKKYLALENFFLMSNNGGKGAAGARNTGLHHASGDFVAFLDSDDYWLPLKLETQVNRMIESNSNFCCSSYFVCDEFGANIGRFSIGDKINYKTLLKSCDIGCSTVIMRKEILVDNRFPSCSKEDYALWLILFKMPQINPCFVHEPLAIYRKTSLSISSNKLQEVFKQWTVLRDYTDLGFPFRLYCLLVYVVKGFIKHTIFYNSK